ncbi:MAG: hypothetical protein ACM3PZ_01435 [Bacillota bacterium]
MEDNNKVVSEPSDIHEDLKELLKQNLEISKDMQAMIKHINSYVAWQRIFGWLKFILILIPIIIGVLYLPPFIREAYRELISIIKSGSGI